MDHAISIWLRFPQPLRTPLYVHPADWSRNNYCRPVLFFLFNTSCEPSRWVRQLKHHLDYDCWLCCHCLSYSDLFRLTIESIDGQLEIEQIYTRSNDGLCLRAWRYFGQIMIHYKPLLCLIRSKLILYNPHSISNPPLSYFR